MGLAVGEVIGDYQVIAHLGAGGMGDVYKVQHVISQRVEALKLLLEGDSSHEIGERFAREIRVLARLQHPNIAALHTAFRSGERLAMVMEYAEGTTLCAKLRPPGITITEGLFYVSQVLSALAYAHKHGVVHRDIKPSNIVIGVDNIVKVVDFGIAVSGRDARLTVSGNVVGSFHYMSPEQIGGSEVDARSDIYSVGVTLYEVVTGKLPVDGPNQYAIMTGHLNHTPAPPGEIDPHVPADLSRTVMKALAKNPNARYQSAEELLSDLNVVQSEYATTMDSMVTVVSPSKRPSGGSGGHHTPSRRKSDLHDPQQVGVLLSEHPAVVDEVGRELASYIGPIAKIIVRRVAKDCSTVHDLFAAVAQEIDSAKDREKFLAAKRRYVR
ncbi:MAG TPA: serine/threonine-protein kinase [Clostridia bacterium]|nr:serine/threonine-protein kinase [Clostridia bacterium]